MKQLTILSLFVAISLFATTSFSLTLKNTVSTDVFEGVTLLKSSTVQDGATETELKAVSHGLRKKAVFGLVMVRVYTAQLLAAKPEALVKTEDGILASLKAAGPVQLNLSFLRNIPGNKISDSFTDGLEANKIDVKNLSADLQKVLEEVKSIKEFKEGESFALTFTWTATGSTVHLNSLAKNTSISGSADLANQLLSIWFGVPADGKLADLKKSLIK